MRLLFELKPYVFAYKSKRIKFRMPKMTKICLNTHENILYAYTSSYLLYLNSNSHHYYANVHTFNNDNDNNNNE